MCSFRLYRFFSRVNYDPAANTDDGSCTYGTPGCTDALACNYASATVDDGSCTHAVAGFDCSGNCLSGNNVTLYLTSNASYCDGWYGMSYTITDEMSLYGFWVHLLETGVLIL